MSNVIQTSERNAIHQTELKILQINMGRSLNITSAVVAYMSQNNYDILLCQEPYNINCKICGIPKRYQIYAAGENRKRAAIIVMNPLIDALLIKQHSNEDLVLVEITYTGRTVLIASLYADITINIDITLHSLDQIIDYFIPCCPLIVGMDSNARSKLWHDTFTNDRGRKMETYIASRDLFIINSPLQGPTFESRRGKSNIDLTIVSGNLVNIVEGWTISKEELCSDHNPITFKIKYSRTHRENVVPSRRRYIHKKDDFDLFGRELRSNLEKVITNDGNNLDEALAKNVEDTLETWRSVENFNNNIENSCKKAFVLQKRRVKVGKRSVPWWNEDLSKKRKEVMRLRRAYQRNRRNETLRQEKKEEYYRAKYLYQKLIGKSKMESWKSAVNLVNIENPWNHIYKSITNKLKTPVILTTIQDRSGELTGDMKTSLNAIMDSFIPTDSDSGDTEAQKELRESCSTPPNTEDDCLFTPAEIKAAIIRFKPNKSPGEDGISSEILMKVFQMFPQFFTSVYNACLKNSYFPNEWKKAIVIPIAKPGKEDSTLPSKFRPISLLNVAGKLLEKLLIDRIIHFLITNQLLSSNQFGFLPQRGTLNALFEVKTYVESNLARGCYTGIVSLDVQGAFDSAWWPSILNQLKQKNCPRNLFELTRSYFSERKAQIILNEHEITREVKRGCPQGSCSSPGFWIIMFDTLLKLPYLQTSKVLAFADDLLLLIEGNSIRELESNINVELKKVKTWADGNKIKFNNDKSKYMVITKKRAIEPMKVTLNDKNIEKVDTLKYLGITLDSKWTFRTHIENICSRCSVLTNQLSKSARITWGLRGSVIKIIYQAAIIPLITYGAPIWSSALSVKANVTKLRRVQRHILIKIIKSYRTISHDAACVISGLLPIELQIKQVATERTLLTGFTLDGFGDEYDAPVLFENSPHPAEYREFAVNKSGMLPVNPGLEIYTDGSKTDQKVGCSFVVMENGTFIESHGFRLHGQCSNNQAEFLAILKSLEWIKSKIQYSHCVTIVTDSKVFLESLNNPKNKIPLISKIRQECTVVEKKTISLTFRWVKAHSGQLGNEKADEVAKNSSNDENLPISYHKVPKSFIKSWSRRKCIDEWENLWHNGNKGQHTKLFFRKIQERMKIGPIDFNLKIATLLSGHGKLRHYLHQRGIIQSPICTCTMDKNQTADHVLFECQLFEAERSQLIQECAGRSIPFEHHSFTICKNAWLKFMNSIDFSKL